MCVNTLQAFCSYITGTLATHAVLKGVGVGDSSASPVAATITWLLKGTCMTSYLLKLIHNKSIDVTYNIKVDQNKTLTSTVMFVLCVVIVGSHTL